MRLSIPARFSEITLGKFIAWHTAKTNVQKVAAITGAPLHEIKKLQVSAITEIVNTVNEVMELKTGLHVKLIDHKNVTYGFIPDVTSMSYYEHADLSAYAKAIWGQEPNDFTHLPGMMAVLYRPVTERVGDKYRIKEYDSEQADHKDEMNDLSMDKVQGALLFFSITRKKLLNASLPYLEAAMTMAMKEVNRAVADLEVTD
jgi:hypothetical protein